MMEASNVIMLYFFPDSRYANSVGVFKAWEKSKQDPELHDFMKYLVNWVAGTKLIVILLLIVFLLSARANAGPYCRRNGYLDCVVLLEAFPAH